MQQFDECMMANRLAHQISLTLIAAVFQEELKVFFSFYSFGEYAQVQIMSQ